MWTHKRQEKEGEREREKQIFELDHTRKKNKDRQKDEAKRYIAKNCRRHQKEQTFIIVYIKNFILKMFIWKSLYQSL